MKMSWKIPAIAGIVMVVLNVVLFAIPFNKTATFWISDAAVLGAIVAQIPISAIAFKNNSTLTSKVYGWPIMMVGLRYLAVITGCAIVLIVLSGSVKRFPIWVSIVVYVVLYGAAAIGLIASESTRNFVQAQDIKLEDRTVFMRKLYAEANALKGSVSDREIVGILTKVAEEIRFSDPTSSEALFEQENELYEIFGDLKEAVKAKDLERTKGLGEKFTQQLEVRNAMCRRTKKN